MRQFEASEDMHRRIGIDVTDFTFSESNRDKIPFAYAADCNRITTTSFANLGPHKLEFIPGEITSAEEGGENGHMASGKVEYGNDMASAKITINGYC